MTKPLVSALGGFIGKWAYRLYLGLGALLVALAVLFTIFPQAATGFNTALFVLQVLKVPVKPQPWFTSRPVREEISYVRPDGLGVADVYYTPDGKRRAALLVFLGANAAGRDDPDVVNFGNALSRAGFTVMFGWSPTMGQRNNIDPAEIENLVWAFQHLRSRDHVDPQRVGMAGFSVGGSFVMVAAADPRIRDDVAFVNSFGAYHDARDFFQQIASNSRFYNGQTEPWAVNDLTRRVFANEIIAAVPDPAERELLTRHFITGVGAAATGQATEGEGESGGKSGAASGDATVSEAELPGLSEQAAISRRLLEGTTPEEAEDLIDRMPADFRQGLQEISPSFHLGEVRARLLIMHDVSDPLIPVGESRRLVRSLKDQAGREDLRYTETEIFDHVRPGSAGGFWGLVKGASKLFLHMYDIIRLAR